MGMAEDVLGVLNHQRFFPFLDDQLCPEADPLALLAERGACCDCEILYSVADDIRLRARCWRAKVGHP